MIDRWRCFVAVPIPPQLRDALAGVVAAWRKEPLAGELRWTEPAGWHLTLAFLGSIRPEVADRTLEQLARVASTHAPSLMTTGGIGTFPSAARARVLWYGIADPERRLRRLAGEVHRALVPLVPELAGEDRFRAHLTLARARAREGVDLSSWLPDRDVPEGRMPVDRVVLYRSHLGRGPAQYEQLGSAALSGTEPEAAPSVPGGAREGR